MAFEVFVPTRARFGAGELDNLHKFTMPGKKALLVISNGKSTRANGSLARTEEQLKKAGVTYTIFDRIEANPLKSTVMAGGACARESGCDFIVALGGGSVMDAAKGIAVVATNDGDLWDYIREGTGKRMPISVNPLPIIAITTTAGTGSETDAGGVITNVETHEKTAVSDPRLFPVLGIIDAELMTTVPANFTAYQGFDALLQSVEGYISNKASRMSDMYALTSIEYVAKSLPTAVHDPGNLEAREDVAFGNYLSGLQMCVGTTTSEHSLEHAMSAFHQDLPHGAGLIMISKAYFTHFAKTGQYDERFIRLAKALGKEDATEAMDFIEALGDLQDACGVGDLKMSDYGIKPDEFPTLAQNAKDSMSWLFKADRIPLSLDDCVAIYSAAYN